MFKLVIIVATVILVKQHHQYAQTNDANRLENNYSV